MPAPAQPVISVQVRELVEFAVRGGDLGGRREFVGPNRALAGTRGHQRVQRSRPAGYEKEVRLSYDLVTPEFTLRIQGRLDGVLVTGTEVLLEEIKTVQGRWDAVADPLHWAQLKVYGYIYAREQRLDRVTLRLAYLNLETGKLTESLAPCTCAELSTFFHSATAIYLEWAQDWHHWRQRRNQSIQSLVFPFPRYRPGQRELAVAAYRAICRSERLFLEAPTGVGKTVSVLFPAVKALGEGKLERIFYLTARTTARAVAEKALTNLRTGGARLRSLTLTAKEKICVSQDQRCDPQTCPLARGYYDRIKPAMRTALEAEEITRPVLELVAQQHQVCPFELSLDLSVWVDAVVADYNYVFDPKVHLRRHFADDQRDYVFLVDEAHNLVDRAREMFSAELSTQQIQPVQRAVASTLPKCARALGRLTAGIRKLDSAPAATPECDDSLEPAVELDLFASAKAGTTPAVASGQNDAMGQQNGVRTSREVPAPLIPLLEQALEEAESWLVRNEPAEFRTDLLELYFQLFSFRRTAEAFDERYRAILAPGSNARLKLFCLDPSFLLRNALGRGKAAILFSATLSPLEYYRDLLGGGAEDPVRQFASPFAPANLAVLVHDRIRTQFKDRVTTVGQVAEAIGALVHAQRGNYLVYFPSYQYLADVLQGFHQLYPQTAVLVQRPGMTDSERADFLAAFAEPDPARVGFAVLGGVFGEGIDLVGNRLIGAVVVGVGLPQLCAERDLILQHFQETIGTGFEYAYLFPGMNRVLQATGRVIRSEIDRGVVLLIDTRFAENRYRRLFPGHWQPKRIRSTADLTGALANFWIRAGQFEELGFSAD